MKPNTEAASISKSRCKKIPLAYRQRLRFTTSNFHIRNVDLELSLPAAAYDRMTCTKFSVTLEEFHHGLVYELWSIVAHDKVAVSVVRHVHHLDVIAVMLPDQRPQEVPGVWDISEEILATMGEEQGDMPRDGREIVLRGLCLVVVLHVLLLVSVVVLSDRCFPDHLRVMAQRFYVSKR